MQKTKELCSLKNELNLFDPIPTQVGVEQGYYVTIKPVAPISQDAPIEFEIPSAGADYVDTNDTRLRVKFKIEAPSGTEAKKFKRGLTNLALSSLFKDASLSLNQVKIEGDSHLTPFTNYMHTLLSYSPEFSKNALSMWGFEKDSTGHMESSKDNVGLASRTENLKSSGDSYEVDGPLPFYFFKQRKYLLSNVEMRITLHPAPASFALMAYKTPAGASDTLPLYTIKLLEVSLSIRRVKILPSISLAHEQGLLNYNAIYPVLRPEPRTYTIQRGTLSQSISSVCNDRIPKLLLVCMVKNSALNGTLQTNPFNFQHFDITKIDLQVNGQSVPRQAPTLDFSGNCAVEYHNFVQAIGLYQCNQQIPISPQEYKNGFTIFAFNFMPDQELTMHKQPYVKANMTLEMQFKTALKEVVNVITIAYYDSQIEITKARNVIANL